MSRFVLRAAAWAAAVLPAAWAGAAPLSIDQAMGLAVQRSELARSARAGAAGAAETVRAAGQQPDPVLSVGLDNLPATGSGRFRTAAEDMTMKRIGIAQEWVPAEKRAAREALARAMHRRELQMEHLAAADTRLQAAMAYLDAYHAGEAASLAALNERHAREALESGKARWTAASGSSAEVLGLSSVLGTAEDETAGQRQLEAAALATLQRWTGATPDALSPPGWAAPPGLDDFVSRHPVVVARQRDIDVAREDAAVARLDRRPNWTYELAYGQRQGRPDLVSVGMSLPLPVAPAARQDREAAAKRALVEKVEADLAEAQRAAAGEYAALDSDARRLQARIDRHRAAALAPLEQRTAATLAAYRANQASLAMLFDARRGEVEARRRQVELQRDLDRVRAQLAFKPVAPGAVP